MLVVIEIRVVVSALGGWRVPFGGSLLYVVSDRVKMLRRTVRPSVPVLRKSPIPGMYPEDDQDDDCC